ncbi:MAG: leucine-rich repeat protein, partial [Clostridiales bacterium]|nr:leucine-rich repeat protein [Clostridiales bacterium]
MRRKSLFAILSVLFTVLCAAAVLACGNGGDVPGTGGDNAPVLFVAVHFDFNDDEARLYTVKIVSGETVDEPFAPVRAGFGFDGWLDEGGAEYDFETPVTEEITLTAKWLPAGVFSVKFYLSYEDYLAGKYFEVKVSDGDKVSQPPTPALENYRFVQWNRSGSAFDFNTAIGTNITLLAEFEYVTPTVYHTVTFTDAANIAKIPSVTVADGKTVPEPAVAPSGGNRLLVWYNDGTGAVYNFGDQVTSDLNLVAHWLDSELELFRETGGKVFPASWLTFVPINGGAEYGVELQSHRTAFSVAAGDYYLPEAYPYNASTGEPTAGSKPVTRVLSEGMYTMEINSSSNIGRFFVPGNYKVIEGDGFKCFRAAELIFGNGVEELWTSALQFTSGHIRLPSSITYIEKFAFRNNFYNSGTGSVTLADGAYYVNTALGILTSDRKTLVYVHKWDRYTEFTLPASITNMYPGLFMESGILYGVTFEGSVDTIPTSAFFGCTNLQRVIFGGSVSRIEGEETASGKYRILAWNQVAGSTSGLRFTAISGRSAGDLVVPIYGAFKNCRAFGITRNLGPVPAFVMPSGLTHIGDFAFYGALLPNVTIGAGVTYIGEGAITASAGSGNERVAVLQSITVAAGNAKFKTNVANGSAGRCLIEIDGVNGDRFIVYCAGRQDAAGGSFTVPNGVTRYDRFAFDAVESIQTPGNNQMKHLESLTLPEGVTELIGASIYLPRLKNLTLPQSVTSLTEGFPGNMWGNIAMSTEDNGWALYPAIDAPLLETLTIGISSSLVTIGHNATAVGYGFVETQANGTFKTILPSAPIDIVLPKTVTGFYFDSFNGNINSITFDDGGPFKSGNGGGIIYKTGVGSSLTLYLVVSPSAVIGVAGAFTLTGINVADLVGISESAFYGLSGLVTVDLSGYTSLTSIGNDAFAYCADLKAIKLPASLADIGQEAFAGLSKLETAEFTGAAPPALGIIETENAYGYFNYTGIFGTLADGVAIITPSSSFGAYFAAL